MEKKRARIPTPRSKLTHPTHRGTVKQESVQPAKAARPANNAQIFTPDPMPRHLGTIELRRAPLEVKKGYAERDFVSSSPQGRFGARMIIGVLSANLTLPDYGRFAREPITITVCRLTTRPTIVSDFSVRMGQTVV
jgi:hypothetical protein